MASIEVEIVPWLTDLLDQPRSGRIKWREEIDQAEPVRSFLIRMHQSYPQLAATMYSIEETRLTGRVNIILNDRALELIGGIDAPLQDGDRLILVPAYTGG